MRLSDATRLQLAQSLVVTGLILYIPANILPVMTMSIVGDVQPLTVLGGVEELYNSGLWPMAAIVCLASLVVPFMKLACMGWILLLHGKPQHRRERSTVHRFIHTIGSWSMVDVFLLSILAAVGQLGTLAGIRAEPGAIFFAAVLVCTLVAAEIYKPRLIWQTSSES